MEEKLFYLVNIGCVRFPSEFEKIFCSKNKFLVSGQVGRDYYFEMNGESMYYMLKSEELTYNCDYRLYKQRIVDAISNRIDECGGILLHKSLLSDELDTQFRATNSAIRILLQAIDDGFDVKREVESLINYQYQFYMPLLSGIWFPHDLSEYEGKCRKRQLKTRIYGKARTNTVTLNTHLDSLNTLILIKLKYSRCNFDLLFDIQSLIDSAINPLMTIFYHDFHSSNISNYIQKIDCWFYKKSKSDSAVLYPISRVYESLLHPIIYKILRPRMFFSYGYIARDLALRHRHADYILPNAVDLARFICLYRILYEDDNKFIIDMKCQLLNTISLIEDIENINLEMSAAWYQELVLLMESLEIPHDSKCLPGSPIYFNPFVLQ